MKKIAKLLAFVVAFAMVASIVVMPASAAELTNLVEGKTGLVYAVKVYGDGNGNYSTSEGEGYTLVQSNTGDESIVPYNAETGEWTANKLLTNTQIVRMITIPGFQVGDFGYVEAKIKYATPLEAGAEDTRSNTIKQSIQGNQGVGGSAVQTSFPKLSDEYQTYSYTFQAKALGTGSNTNFHLGFEIAGIEDVCVKEYVIYKLPAYTATAGAAETTYTTAKASFAFDEAPAALPTATVKTAAGATAGTATVAATAEGYDVTVTGLTGGTTYDVTITGKNSYGVTATATKTVTTQGPAGVYKTTAGASKRDVKDATAVVTNDSNVAITLADGKTSGTAGFEKTSIKTKPNTTYYIAAKVKFADGVDASKVTATAAVNTGHNCYKATRTTISTDNAVGTGWKLVEGVIANTTGSASDGLNCSTSSHSTYYANNNMLMHVGFAFTVNADTSIDFKDFVVVEMSPTTVTAAPAATENVDGSTTIDYTFSNIATLTEADVVLSGAGNVAVTKNSDTSYTVALSGLTPASDYTVTINAKDAVKDVVTNTVEFSTAAYAAPKSDFASVCDNLSQTNSGKTHTITNLGDGVWEVHKSTAEADEAKLTHGVQDINNTVEKCVYIVSAKVKNLDETPKPNATASAFISVSGNSAHNIMSNQTSPAFKIADNQWHTITSRSEIKQSTTACNCTGEKCEKANSTAHFGVSTNSVNFNFQVKDLTLRKAVVLSNDENYYAYTEDNGDGTATLYIAKYGDAATIYFAVATYDGAKMTSISFQKADIAANGANSATVTISDNAKVMIWDSNMKPLHNTFLGSDI